MRRHLHLLRAAWWGVLASQVELLDRLASVRKAPLLGAAALALVLAPALALLHHGTADERYEQRICVGFVSPEQALQAAPIPLAQATAQAAPIPLAQGTAHVAILRYHGRPFEFEHLIFSNSPSFSCTNWRSYPDLDWHSAEHDEVTSQSTAQQFN